MAAGELPSNSSRHKLSESTLSDITVQLGDNPPVLFDELFRQMMAGVEAGVLQSPDGAILDDENEAYEKYKRESVTICIGEEID